MRVFSQTQVVTACSVNTSVHVHVPLEPGKVMIKVFLIYYSNREKIFIYFTVYILKYYKSRHFSTNYLIAIFIPFHYIHFD